MMRRLLPRHAFGLRARLVLGFLAVVTIALILVFATLPRLLDSYFAEQSQADLDRRAGIAKVELTRAVALYQFSGGAARPILAPTSPLTAAEGLREVLGPDSDFARQVPQIVQADVTITLAPDREHADEIVYHTAMTLPDSFGQSGQQREPISSQIRSGELVVRDAFWTQSGAAPDRLFRIQLSNPFTYRAETLEQVVQVMTIAGAIGLVVAVVASILFASRLARPIRRLTGAARELSEGHLDVRVVPPSASPEIRDLSEAFNAMAARLQNSIDYIRRDRDRSRDFLADVSHELRTPIAALRTFNELLTDGAVMDEPTRREFLDQSRQQIERLDWLATNLLELSKLDSGLVLLDLRPDDLRAVVENALQQALPSADRKGVSLRMSVPPEPVRQMHDPQRLGQVVTNLIGNAIKFTPTDGTVEVTLEETPTGAEIRVVDTGVGIDPQELPFVFERFYRGAKAHESRAAGSGLGLSIVRSIVEMHDGRIAISSTPGKGTQVSVALPRDASVSVSSPAAVRA